MGEEDDAVLEKDEEGADEQEEEDAPAALLENDDATPTQCVNRDKVPFQCAANDRCCGDVCVAQGDVCCVNVHGNFFPCQGKGGQCCGNACAAPGSRCCRSPFVERSRWYPVSRDTQCAFALLEEDDAVLEKDEEGADGQEEDSQAALLESEDATPKHCVNRDKVPFQCAAS